MSSASRRLADVGAAFGEVRRDAVFARTGFAGDGGEDASILCCAASSRWLKRALAQPATAAVVAPPELAGEVPDRLGLLAAEDAEIAFWELHNALAEMARAEAGPGEVHPDAEIHPAAIVEPGARIGPGARVAAGAVIKACAVLEEGVRVDEAAVIGAEGLFVRRRPGRLLRVVHAGGVRIGRESWIMAGAQASRAVFAGETRLGARVALGPGAAVGHGVEVGEDASIAGGAQVAGFSRVGDGAWIGPGAVISSEIEIGDGARVELGAVAGVSVPAGERWSGFFARPHRVMLRIGAALTRDHG